MTLRQALFWMHLVAGVVVAAIVLLMSVTGVALTYQRQLTELARRDNRSDAAARGAQPRQIEAVLASLREASPDFEPSSITLLSDPAEPALVSQGRRGRLYVDRYDGTILGDGSSATSAFMGTMVAWHRWLGQEGDGRDVGRVITGASNLGFLFLVLSGPVLWWPRNWSRASVRNATWFRGGLRGKARDFNWHNVIGLWATIPLLVIVASGVVISYSWAGNLVYTLTGSEPPSRGRRGEASSPPGLVNASFDASDTGIVPSLDELIAVAASESPGWRSITIDLPRAGDGSVSFSIDTSPGGQPAARTRLVLDRTSGAVVAREGHADQSLGSRLRGWFRFAHTGEVYGFVGQTIAGIASAGAVVLVWTGLALTWRRFFGRARS